MNELVLLHTLKDFFPSEGVVANVLELRRLRISPEWAPAKAPECWRARKKFLGALDDHFPEFKASLVRDVLPAFPAPSGTLFEVVMEVYDGVEGFYPWAAHDSKPISPSWVRFHPDSPWVTKTQWGMSLKNKLDSWVPGWLFLLAANSCAAWERANPGEWMIPSWLLARDFPRFTSAPLELDETKYEWKTTYTGDRVFKDQIYAFIEKAGRHQAKLENAPCDDKPPNPARNIADDGNLGVLLGEPSHGLADIDIDSSEALGTVPAFSPPTDRRSGRSGKPGSHLWFRSQGGKTRQFQDPLRSKDGGMLVEIRSTSCQTVVPPSIHPSGEPFVWENEGEPSEIARPECRARSGQGRFGMPPGPLLA